MGWSSSGADLCGGEASPGADVGGGEPSPGADVGGVSPVPARMWAAAHLLVRPVRRVVDVHVADILPLDLSSGRR